MEDKEALFNWCLERIVGLTRSPNQQVTSEDLAILRAGTYVDTLTGDVTNFTLPKNIQALLHESK